MSSYFKIANSLGGQKNVTMNGKENTETWD